METGSAEMSSSSTPALVTKEGEEEGSEEDDGGVGDGEDDFHHHHHHLRHLRHWLETVAILKRKEDLLLHLRLLLLLHRRPLRIRRHRKWAGPWETWRRTLNRRHSNK